MSAVIPTTPEMVQAAKRNADRQSASADPLLTRSKDSAAMLPYWDLTDDLIEGAAAVKVNPMYLPQFPNEDESTYKLRLCLTKYTNVYGDIVESLASKPFEEEVSLIKEKEKEPPEPIKNFLEDVDGAGNNLTVFAGGVFFAGINSAIHWIFVDNPKIDRSVIRTVADAKKAGIRPFWSHVLGRNVLKATTQIVGGTEQLVYIKIFEPGEPNHVRIFTREGATVTWELWEETDSIQNAETQSRYKKIDGGPLGIDRIPLVPFVTGRRDGRSFKIHPPMRAAADTQIELYQQESGLKFIKNMAAYPMLAANGLNPVVDATGKPLPLALGPMRVLYGKPDNNGNHGTWSILEPSATSMKFLADDIGTTTQNLRELGRQPLTAQSGNLTVITTAVAAGKAASAVGAWALLLKDALENALVITAQWLGVQYDPQVNVYTEFDNFMDSDADKNTLIEMRKNGDLSRETLFFEMKRRSVLSPEFDAEDEMERILEETPGDGEEDDLPNSDKTGNTGDPVIPPGNITG